MTISCSSNATRTVEVQAAGASCSQQVSCTVPQPEPQLEPQPKQYAVGVSYVDAFWENEFVICVYDPTLPSTDYKPSDLKYTYIPTSTIAYVYYRGKTEHTITDRFSVAPSWTSHPDTITCYFVEEFCNTMWVLSDDVKYDLKSNPDNPHNLENAVADPSHITAIMNHVDYPAAEVYKKYFYVEKVPPECNDVTPTCRDSTAIYHEEGRIFKTKRFMKSVTFTVY